MLLASAILSSIGGLAILLGSVVQLSKGYSLYAARRTIEVWVVQGDNKTPNLWDPARNAVPQLGHYERVAVDVEGRYVKDDSDYALPKFPTRKSLSYAGVYGWSLILAGGALVLAGSVVLAISAAGI